MESTQGSISSFEGYTEDLHISESVLQVGDLPLAENLRQLASRINIVCRIICPGNQGTGFVIDNGLLLTNHHIIPNLEQAQKACVQFFYERSRKTQEIVEVRLNPDESEGGLFLTSETPDEGFLPLTKDKLDFTIVAFRLPLPHKLDFVHKMGMSIFSNVQPIEGGHANIIQHPSLKENGVMHSFKRYAFWKNKIKQIEADKFIVHYETTTLRGSSGAPVMDDQGDLLGLHRARCPNQQHQNCNTAILASAIAAAVLERGYGQKIKECCSIFQSEVRLNFLSLSQDEDLQKELNYYIPLDASRSLKDEPKDLEEQVESFISSSNRILLILGEAASGKSLFVRYLALKKGKAYASEKDFLPIYISLSSVKQADRVLEEGLQYIVSPENLPDFLKEKKLLLFLDAYDEMPCLRKEKKEKFIEKQRKLFNIYLENNLKLRLHNDTKIIFTCRITDIQAEDLRYFYPDGKTPQGFNKLILADFDPGKQISYLTKYLAIQKEKGLSPSWTVEKYWKYFNNISGLKEIVKNPLLLFVTAEVLPSIVEKFKKERSNSEEKLHLTETRILDEFIVQRILREYNRQTENSLRPQYSKEDYLTFALDLIAQMSKEGKYVISRTDPSLMKKFQRFFCNSEEAIFKRKAIPLTCSEGKEWKFIHDKFRAHFEAMWQQFELGREEEILELLGVKKESF